MTTTWLTISCTHCEHVIDDVLLEAFDKPDYPDWQFNLFGQRDNQDLIIESPRSAFIAGICPRH